MIEPVKSTEDYLRAEYWKKPGVKKGVSQFLGSKVLDWEMWEDSDICSEFLAVSTREKLYREDKNSPAYLINPYQFKKAYYDHLGQVELQNSIWQRSNDQEDEVPSRNLLFWDVELFDNNNPLYPIDDSLNTFSSIDNINQLITQQFKKYGLDYQSIMSGRGYNYVSQINDESPVIEDLLDISGTPEQTVLDKQKYPNISNKRQKIVPVKAELLHMASVRLQQYIFNCIIREARRTQPLPVEISDKGNYGISLDNTAMMYSVENRSIGTLGSPYFIKLEKNNPDYVKTVIKIPVENNNISISYKDALDIRSSYEQANVLMGDMDCSIPEGSKGVKKLIADYKKSKLYTFHTKMDECHGDDPDFFEGNYRNYESIANQTENPDYIKYLMDNANDLLLKPDNLDYFIWSIFKSWGGNNDFTVAGHVAGLLRSIYEDPKFEWGSKFIKTDANRYARGWVMAVIGQAFEDDNK
jgi:hypothetical protein